MKNFPTLVKITAESLIKQAIPPIGMYTEIYKQYQEEKFNFFLDEVQRKTADISIKNLNDYDILHTSYLTQQALLKIRQQEKIKLLADLFVSYCHKLQPKYNNALNDKYEIFLQLLENISFVEFNILMILYSQLNNIGADCGGRMDDEETFYNDQVKIWGIFIDLVKERLQLSDDELEAYLQRLTTTGLFVKFRKFIDDKGYLTQLFYELVDFLKY